MPTPRTKPGSKTPAKVRLRKASLPKIKQLSEDEYDRLRNLLLEAHDSNVLLINNAQDLADARLNMLSAEEEVKRSERRMAEERSRNANLHTKIAPLLHRLPTV